MDRIVGIDPGKNGAIAVLDNRGEIVVLHDMPLVANGVSGLLLSKIVEDIVFGFGPDITAVVEQVHSMPKQGVASSFDFGKSYGIALGVLAGNHIRVEHVRPNRWKKEMRLTADKEQARQRAIERWPSHVEYFARKKDADRAEAALLALWWIERGADR